MDSLSKDEMEIIRVEKKIQKLKNKYETDKSDLLSKILDIKNIHCRITKEKFKEITTSSKFRK
jgi:thiamine pyrophosphokinase